MTLRRGYQTYEGWLTGLQSLAGTVIAFLGVNNAGNITRWEGVVAFIGSSAVTAAYTVSRHGLKQAVIIAGHDIEAKYPAPPTVS